MGQSRNSTGRGAIDTGLTLEKKSPQDQVIALAGNPNVGKSTLFNAFTGLRQHTGNWPGKTVANAQGYCTHNGQGYLFVDLPGCYSLLAHSAEEEAARDFICFENPDAVVVICDATCLERNLILVLQVIEANPRTIVCVNLLDEAKKKKLKLDLNLLEQRLGTPVIGTAARTGKGLERILEAVPALGTPAAMEYGSELEELLTLIEKEVKQRFPEAVNPRWLSVRLLDADLSLQKALCCNLFHSEDGAEMPIQEVLEEDIRSCTKKDLAESSLDSMQEMSEKPFPDYKERSDNGDADIIFNRVQELLRERSLTKEQVSDRIAETYGRKAAEIASGVVSGTERDYNRRDRVLDRLFTSKWTGFPIMFLLLLSIFWITIVGANYPSQLLSRGLFFFEDQMDLLFRWIGIPEVLIQAAVHGMYRVLAWVVSVMLPPMAIFFPLFTLLEDSGYLPRVAFNMDRCFCCCKACGKQSLTMMMGFGCNAAGVVGCRIIDSKRERLIAILTNCFVPCNGRFPMMLTIITIFFAWGNGAGASFWSALIMGGLILIGILMTFLVSRILSSTLLKGVPSSFTLELPSYRKPQIGKVLVRSVFDRTLFVLGRAAAVAAPAGLIIWLFSNITINGNPLLAVCSGALDPLGKLLGMDGVILLAFFLGLPANEIVLPIILTAYLSQGTLMEAGNLLALKQVLLEHGWTWLTAVNILLFSLLHWPCSTTCITIRKETQSRKWTLAAVLIPTAAGFAICFVFTAAVRLILKFMS